MVASAYPANTHLQTNLVHRAKTAREARQGGVQLYLGIFLAGKTNHDQVILHVWQRQRPMT